MVAGGQGMHPNDPPSLWPGTHPRSRDSFPALCRLLDVLGYVLNSMGFSKCGAALSMWVPLS